MNSIFRRAQSIQGYPGLVHQPDGNATCACPALKRFLRSQFGRPTGLWGHVAGAVMARTRSNLERIEWTLSLLEAQDGHRILEVGFGPGVAIHILSRAIPAARITGVDHSPVMLRQAGRRNAHGVRSGRVVLTLGSVTALPIFDGQFDRIFTINSIHFWPDPVQCLNGLHQVLKPGGRIAVTIQPRSRGATDSTARVIGEEVVANLAKAGFSSCRLEIRRMHPVAVACALATKEAHE